MEVREQRKIIKDLKLRLISLKSLKYDDGEVMRSFEEQYFAKAKGGLRMYIEVFDYNFADIVYEVKSVSAVRYNGSFEAGVVCSL